MSTNSCKDYGKQSWGEQKSFLEAVAEARLSFAIQSCNYDGRHYAFVSNEGAQVWYMKLPMKISGAITSTTLDAIANLDLRNSMVLIGFCAGGVRHEIASADGKGWNSNSASLASCLSGVKVRGFIVGTSDGVKIMNTRSWMVNDQ